MIILPNSLTSQHDERRWRSRRGGIVDNIKLALYKYFCFSETKNRNILISLVFNKNRCHKCRHDISPVFTGIPVFLSCQRSFLWKSQNRFKNLGDFYGGGGGGIFAG